MKHALTLGLVGVVLGLVGVITTWNLGLGSRWYPVALALLAIPQCWLGGKIYEMRGATPSHSRPAWAIPCRRSGEDCDARSTTDANLPLAGTRSGARLWRIRRSLQLESRRKRAVASPV